MNKLIKKYRVFFISLTALFFIVLAGVIATLVVMRRSPSTAAQGADVLRGLFGDRTVAQLEMLVFQLEDEVTGVQYALGIKQVEAPWQPQVPKQVEELTQLTVESVSANAASPTQTITPTMTAAAEKPTGEQGLIQVTEVSATVTVTPFNTATPSSSPTPVPWKPGPVEVIGSLEGEGFWSPYIWNNDGETIGFRSFLQPDPDRPYTIVAAVALDTDKIQLNFVPGFEEPYNPEVERSGEMPEEDKVPGLLLASFNGGFKAQHGAFGAMADGLEILPPRDEMATVVMYSDGRLDIGEWGRDFDAQGEYSAWRQNGPLVIQDGEINPRIYSNSPDDWGYTVDDYSPTLRSGLGISEDGRTLYFVIGTKAIMESMAASMAALGIEDGMQLDINNYWVHFVTYPVNEAELIAEPLLPELMIENLDRYLYPFGRDYFYVTGK